MYNKRFYLFPIFALGFILLGGLAVMLLWNNIMPELIPTAGTLTYIKAIGLLILCRILFGGFKGRGGRPPIKDSRAMKEKMMNMTPEEREKFKAEWRDRCGRR
ncbi:MAG: hypothetical protein SGJ10_01885 [Bacteroidota bacterium]|nr:hypothetical protein [Bacteroidota bacterium]